MTAVNDLLKSLKQLVSGQQAQPKQLPLTPNPLKTLKPAKPIAASPVVASPAVKPPKLPSSAPASKKDPSKQAQQQANAARMKAQAAGLSKTKQEKLAFNSGGQWKLV